MTNKYVYVVEADIYEEQYIAGIYASEQAATAAHPGVWRDWYPSPGDPKRLWNGLHGAQYKTIAPYELQR